MSWPLFVDCLGCFDSILRFYYHLRPVFMWKADLLRRSKKKRTKHVSDAFDCGLFLFRIPNITSSTHSNILAKYLRSCYQYLSIASKHINYGCYDAPETIRNHQKPSVFRAPRELWGAVKPTAPWALWRCCEPSARGESMCPCFATFTMVQWSRSLAQLVTEIHRKHWGCSRSINLSCFVGYGCNYLASQSSHFCSGRHMTPWWSISKLLTQAFCGIIWFSCGHKF